MFWLNSGIKHKNWGNILLFYCTNYLKKFAMKHWILCSILILGTFTSWSQDEKITVDLGEFTEVRAFDGLSVNLIKSSENKAVITGNNTKKVAVVNNDGVLKLRMEVTSSGPD